MQSSGTTGRGGSNHQPDAGLLAGLLSTDRKKFYPEDRCALCEAEGRTDEECFTHHWKPAHVNPDRPVA